MQRSRILQGLRTMRGMPGDARFRSPSNSLSNCGQGCISRGYIDVYCDYRHNISGHQRWYLYRNFSLCSWMLEVFLLKCLSCAESDRHFLLGRLWFFCTTQRQIVANSPGVFLTCIPKKYAIHKVNRHVDQKYFMYFLHTLPKVPKKFSTYSTTADLL